MNPGRPANGLGKARRILYCTQARLGTVIAQLDKSTVCFDTLTNMLAKTAKAVSEKM